MPCHLRYLATAPSRLNIKKKSNNVGTFEIGLDILMMTFNLIVILKCYEYNLYRLVLCMCKCASLLRVKYFVCERESRFLKCEVENSIC